MNYFGLDVDAIEAVARRELRDEQHRAAVEARKAELRAQRGMGLWQRLFNKLPFTITIERKKP